MSGEKPGRPSRGQGPNRKPSEAWSNRSRGDGKGNGQELKSRGFKGKPKGAPSGEGRSRGFKSHNDKREGARFDNKRSPKPDFKNPKPDLLESEEERPAAEERIAKRLARAGVASRREAEALIVDGRISLNGTVLKSPAINVGPADEILIDGKPIPTIERTRLWLYHKPAGLVTSNSDPEGRPTVFQNLPTDLPRVISVGRLDMNTEGLLLLTNDGGLARVLELPQTGWLRRYRVRAHGRITQGKLDTLKDGIAVDGVFYGAIDAVLEREQGANVWIEMGLREGKNREVRNVLGALGLQVNRLIRVSYGPFQLGELPEGTVMEIKGKTLRDQLGKRLVEESGANFEAPILNAFPNRPVKAEKASDKTDRAEKPKSDWVSSSAGRRGKPSSLDRLSTQKPEPPKHRSADGSRASNVWMASGARPTGGGAKRGSKPKLGFKSDRKNPKR